MESDVRMQKIVPSIYQTPALLLLKAAALIIKGASLGTRKVKNIYFPNSFLIVIISAHEMKNRHDW